MENKNLPKEDQTNKMDLVISIVHLLVGFIISIGAYIAYTKSGLTAIYLPGGRIYMYILIFGLLIVFQGLNLLKNYFTHRDSSQK